VDDLLETDYKLAFAIDDQGLIHEVPQRRPGLYGAERPFMLVIHEEKSQKSMSIPP